MITLINKSLYFFCKYNRLPNINNEDYKVDPVAKVLGPYELLLIDAVACLGCSFLCIKFSSRRSLECFQYGKRPC